LEDPLAATSARSPAPAWKPLVVCPQAELARRISTALHELVPGGAIVKSEYPRLGALRTLLQETSWNICFLDVASNSEHGQALIAEAAPAIPVVALHQRNDADLILRCLRRGACEYLTDPTPETIRALFERLARQHPGGSGRPPGIIYCVIPGKPGSGASSLAVQLAATAHTAAAPEVLLIDADPLNCSVAFLLKLKSEFHLGDVLRDWKRMDDDLWARLTVPAAGIDVLPAPESADERIEVAPTLAVELGAWWRERYAVTVLDLPDVRAAVSTGFAALADTVLLVTTNELGALQSTRRAMSFLAHSGMEAARLKLVLNRYVPATGLKREDVKTALGVEPFATLANDYEVMQAALLDGKPAPAGSRFAASVQALAERLRPQSAAAPKARGSWLATLLHR
jgi:Flp pilus assembly CpaE family ATPase